MSYGGSCFRSTIGRFASADTIVPDAADPQSYNRYSYGYNNPVKYIDPTGHCASDIYDDYDCWDLLWRLERDWGIDIEDEYLWGYKHLQSLEKIFQEFASFLGSDQWKEILAESAKLGGRDKFLVRGTLAEWDVSEGGICTTGCDIFGEVRFNLGLSFSDQNPGFGALGDWYRNPLGRGQLTMAHEFAHILLGVKTELQDIYNSTSGWDTSSNSWVGRHGMIDNPTEHLVQLIALYVTPGNTWGEVEASGLGDTGPITPYDQWYVGNFIPYSFNE